MLNDQQIPAHSPPKPDNSKNQNLGHLSPPKCSNLERSPLLIFPALQIHFSPILGLLSLKENVSHKNLKKSLLIQSRGAKGIKVQYKDVQVCPPNAIN